LKALEHEPNFLSAEPRARILGERAELRTVERHRAARGHVEAGEQREERRLAAPRWSDHGHEGAFGDVEGDVAQYR
jgi:hypothetical protein